MQAAHGNQKQSDQKERAEQDNGDGANPAVLVYTLQTNNRLTLASQVTKAESGEQKRKDS